MKLLTVAALVFCGSAALNAAKKDYVPPFLRDTVAKEQALSGSSEIHWWQFSASVMDAKRVVVYYGFPRGEESDTAAKIEFDGFEFRQDPRTLEPAAADELTRMISSLDSFYEYRGSKFCGGFHPDLCIEWQFERDGQSWHKRAFACLGCNEWRLIDGTSALHTDMPKAVAETLRSFLDET